MQNRKDPETRVSGGLAKIAVAAVLLLIVSCSSSEELTAGKVRQLVRAEVDDYLFSKQEAIVEDYLRKHPDRLEAVIRKIVSDRGIAALVLGGDDEVSAVKAVVRNSVLKTDAGGAPVEVVISIVGDDDFIVNGESMAFAELVDELDLLDRATPIRIRGDANIENAKAAFKLAKFLKREKFTNLDIKKN